MKTRTAAVLGALLVAASPLVAQTLELRSGRVLIGRVVAVAADHLRFESGYPEPESIDVPREDVAPASLYAVLADRADPQDAAARLALAETCIALGLPGHAIAELELVLRLDPARRPALAPRLETLRNELAARLAAEAEDHLAEGRWPEAKLTAEVVIDRHPGTKAAARAQAVVAASRAQAAAEASAKARAAADRKAAAKALKLALSHEKEADAQGTGGAPGTTVKELRRRETAVAHLEAAWKSVEDAGDEAPAAVRERLRDKLKAEYLAVAATHLARRALPAAESFNAKACALDPDGGGCRRLQDLIIQARIVNGR